MEAKDCKCCVCEKQAVAFYPVIDPDIPSYPYCADCLEKALVNTVKLIWELDADMLAIATDQARKATDKYR